MVIELENISKRYGMEWIFKSINYQFEIDNKYAIIGSNGSGKSTLLKIISGGLQPTFGKINYRIEHKRNPTEDEICKKINFAAPYISIIDDFTLTELLDFHFKFKKNIFESKNDFLDYCYLTEHKNKLVKNFSSGMKQRLKLALAILSDAEIVLLDEPTSNLDTKGIDFYFKLINEFTTNKTIIIGSNQEIEYDFCNQKLSIADYK